MKCIYVLGVILTLFSSGMALEREAFTITSYDLNLHLDPQQQRLGVRGQITLRNDSAQPQRVVALQISSSLNWRSIRFVRNTEPQMSADSPDFGQSVQFIRQPFTSDIDHTGELSEAIVTLPSEVASRNSVVLAISYEGVILLDATRLTRVGTPERVARHSDWDQIGKTFTAVRGVGYVTWYPVAMESQNLSEGTAMFAALGKWKARHANSKMALHVELVTNAPDTPRLLVNGKNCAASEDTSNGFAVLNGCAFDHVGWQNPTLVVGNFQETIAGPVRIHSAAEDDSVAREFAKNEERVAYMNQDWFGAPKHNLDVIDLADPEAAPFEAGSWLLLPLAKHNPSVEQTLLVHQFTHVSLESPRLWIYEGTAHFAQALAAEKDGRDAALESLAPHRDAVMQSEKQPGEALFEATEEVVYRSKAALVWWMLRDMVGDAALKRVFHAYRAEDDQSPDYLLHLIATESKRDLGWFFHDWIDTDAGLPNLQINSANARHTTGTNFVTAVTVANSGNAGVEVPVTIHTLAGDFTQRLEVRGKASAVTRIATPAEPVEVVVNDGSVPEAAASGHRLKIGNDGEK